MSLRRSFDPQSSNPRGWPKDETDPEPLLAARPASDPLLLHGSDEIVTQPFAQYLRDNHSAINNNLNELDHNFSYSYFTRIFNALTYANAQTVIDCSVDAVTNNQVDDWCTFAFAQACTEMLDKNGLLLAGVEQQLQKHPVLARFFSQHKDESNTISAYLVAAYFVGLINEISSQKIMKALPMSSSENLKNSKPLKYSQQVNHKNEALKLIDRQTIELFFKRLREIANDSDYPAKGLQQAIKDLLYFKYGITELEKAINTSSNASIKNAATNVLIEAKKIAFTSPENLPAIANALHATSAVVRNPQNPANVKILQNQAYKMSHRSWGIMLGGAMLALAGVTIALASTATALVSFGALAPVSVLGFTLGASMLVGGIAVGAGVAGATAGITGATLFGMGTKRNKQRKQLRQDMEALAKTVNLSRAK